jgi:DNA-binding XRE family transcriptional regulator
MPVAVVVPYEEYAAAFVDAAEQGHREATVPHEVAVRALREQISPVRAWREYLCLTQAEVARRMHISQSAFAQMEMPECSPSTPTIKKIAAAMELSPAQLKW